MTRPPVFNWTQSNVFESIANGNVPSPYETAQVRIFAATWNMQGRSPSPEDLKSLLHPEAVHHDIFCIGSQESLKTIAGSMFSPSKEALNTMIATCLGEHFKMVSSVSLQATHLVVFANITLIPLISEVSHDDIATGFKNLLGNKGAVTVRFRLGQTSIRIVNAHFHSGDSQVEMRSQEVRQTFAKFCAPAVQ